MDEGSIRHALDDAETFVATIERFRETGPQPFTITEPYQVSRLRQMTGRTVQVGDSSPTGFANTSRGQRDDSDEDDDSAGVPSSPARLGGGPPGTAGAGLPTPPILGDTGESADAPECPPARPSEGRSARPRPSDYSKAKPATAIAAKPPKGKRSRGRRSHAFRRKSDRQGSVQL